MGLASGASDGVSGRESGRIIAPRPVSGSFGVTSGLSGRVLGICVGALGSKLGAWTKYLLPCWRALLAFSPECCLLALSGPLQLASGPSLRCLVLTSASG